MYNTTTAPLEAGNEAGNGTNQNRDVTLGDFAVTQRDGVDVFTFALDINQLRPDPLLSLNHISIFMGDGSLTGYDAGLDTLGGVAAVWAMAMDACRKASHRPTFNRVRKYSTSIAPSHTKAPSMMATLTKG